MGAAESADDWRSAAIEREAGDSGEGDDGNADGAEGYGRGVGEQADGRGVEGGEAEADHHGCGDGYGSAEAGAAFDEGSEGEGDEQRLHALSEVMVPMESLMISNLPVLTVIS